MSDNLREEDTARTSHTRTLSSNHHVPALQTSGLAPHTQQLTSIPPELPQLMVTTPTTVYSAYTSPSSFGTNPSGSPFSPPTHIPDVPVPAIPEAYRTQPASQAVGSPPQSPPAVARPPVIITSNAPPATQPRFASPMTANPNAPILPRLSTPGSPVVTRKPVPPLIASPSSVKARKARTDSPATGSMSTMSPVAAARSFNSRPPRIAIHPHAVDADKIDSPTPATASLYAETKGRDKADISAADRVVGREMLFDLDVDGDKGSADARELPLQDLVAADLPEYIQVYLTPHPERDGVGAKAAFGDEKLGVEVPSKEKEAEMDYERRAAKWEDIEATLPAYKSTPSLHRALPVAAPKRSRRCVPAKPSTRVACIAILVVALLVVPLVSFGVVYSLQLKGKHAAQAPDAMPAFDPNDPTVTILDAPPVTNAPPPPPPIVAPMTTATPNAQKVAAEAQIAVGN